MQFQTDRIDEIDFSKAGGLVPAIVQDHQTGAVLMLGYMNIQALRQTVESRRVTFYSRSKERLWIKGETSGNHLELIDVRMDCDRDALLILAHPTGPVCHTGSKTCFGDQSPPLGFLAHLEEVIRTRQENPQKGSYTSSLFQSGLDKIAQKVGEEAVETVIEAKNNDQERFLDETADLIYHLLILLRAKGTDLASTVSVLEHRHQ